MSSWLTENLARGGGVELTKKFRPGEIKSIRCWKWTMPLFLRMKFSVRTSSERRTPRQYSSSTQSTAHPVLCFQYRAVSSTAHPVLCIQYCAFSTAHPVPCSIQYFASSTCGIQYRASSTGHPVPGGEAHTVADLVPAVCVLFGAHVPLLPPAVPHFARVLRITIPPVSTGFCVSPYAPSVPRMP
eukprot:3235045-Rhodomonas_salina.1